MYTFTRNSDRRLGKMDSEASVAKIPEVPLVSSRPRTPHTRRQAIVMNDRCRLLIVAAFIGLICGCTPSAIVPNAAMFSGETGGCGNCHVYRFNGAKTLAVSVHIDESALNLERQPLTIEFDSNSKTVEVEVLQFRAPATEYFCDDVAGDAPPIAEWNAVSGTIVFQSGATANAKKTGNATHKVSATLQNVRVKNKKTGAVAVLKEVEISDVSVGWLPG